jgi:hypothetical protein
MENRMTTLKISASIASLFRAAAGDSAAKKAAWSVLRDAYDIQGSIKLGCETDPASPNFGLIWVKDSSPRQFLLADGDDAFSGRTATADQLASRSAAAPVVGSLLVADDNDDARRWKAVDRDDLLELLRDYDSGYTPVLPKDFPAGLGVNALVLDSTTGALYFRA